MTMATACAECHLEPARHVVVHAGSGPLPVCSADCARALCPTRAPRTLRLVGPKRGRDSRTLRLVGPKRGRDSPPPSPLQAGYSTLPADARRLILERLPLLDLLGSMDELSSQARRDLAADKVVLWRGIYERTIVPFFGARPDLVMSSYRAQTLAYLTGADLLVSDEHGKVRRVLPFRLAEDAGLFEIRVAYDASLLGQRPDAFTAPERVILHRPDVMPDALWPPGGDPDRRMSFTLVLVHPRGSSIERRNYLGPSLREARVSRRPLLAHAVAEGESRVEMTFEFDYDYSSYIDVRVDGREGQIPDTSYIVSWGGPDGINPQVVGEHHRIHLRRPTLDLYFASTFTLPIQTHLNPEGYARYRLSDVAMRLHLPSRETLDRLGASIRKERAKIDRLRKEDDDYFFEDTEEGRSFFKTWRRACFAEDASVLENSWKDSDRIDDVVPRFGMMLDVWVSAWWAGDHLLELHVAPTTDIRLLHAPDGWIRTWDGREAVLFDLKLLHLEHLAEMVESVPEFVAAFASLDIADVSSAYDDYFNSTEERCAAVVRTGPDSVASLSYDPDGASTYTDQFPEVFGEERRIVQYGGPSRIANPIS